MDDSTTTYVLDTSSFRKIVNELVHMLYIPDLRLVDELLAAGQGGCVVRLASFNGANACSLDACTYRTPAPDNVAGQKEISLEKQTRLASHPDHRLASESKDARYRPKRYAGAVRGHRYIVTVSGYRQWLDELLAAAILIRIDDLTVAEAMKLLRRNEYLARVGKDDLFNVNYRLAA